MNSENYFDHASTTFLEPEVLEAMLPWMSSANAHSLHSAGRAAMDVVEDCRARCAMALGAEDPSQIIFTSGATEANNWIAQLFKDGLTISPFEHSSMREPALHYGGIELKNRAYEMEPATGVLQCVMLVNNETGAILTPPKGTMIHRDITQAVGKVPVDVFGMDFASLSAHKFGGPKGIGLLYAEDTLALRPFHYGGEQELGLRAGTLNVAGIVGLATALDLAVARQPQKTQDYLTLKHILFDELQGLADWSTDPDAPHSPAIVSLSFAGVEGETLVIELDALGFAVSSGAACSNRSHDPSHVLMALGYEETLLRGTVRISFGPSNTPASVTALARALRSTVENIRK